MEAKPREDPAMRIATVSADFKTNLAVRIKFLAGDIQAAEEAALSEEVNNKAGP